MQSIYMKIRYPIAESDSKPMKAIIPRWGNKDNFNQKSAVAYVALICIFLFPVLIAPKY
jgi:hypothetical protein